MRFLPVRRRPAEAERADPPLSLQSYVELLTSFNFQGVSYTLPGAQQEEIRDFASLARGALKSCVVVSACMDVRSALFTEATFQFRNVSSGRAQNKLFGTAALEPLEVPWPGGTTGDLLAWMLLHHDLAGNAFVVRNGPGLAVLRPDWVDIVSGSNRQDGDVWDPDAHVVGYVFHPSGRNSGRPVMTFLPEQMCHFAFKKDPEARWRGMSWLTPAINEIMADKAATLHKQQFFSNSGTPNMLVKFDIDAVEKMRPWIEMFREQHEGAANAYKTLFLGAGTDATAIGHNFQQMEFKVTQGAGETRIAAAAGVPPVIVGLSEGLQAATYSNYSQARRRFADGTMRPLWRNVCGSLANIIQVPGGAELWYDDRDIPALKEDIQDKAKEMSEKAIAANQFVSAGYTRESVVVVLDTGDFTQLVPDPNPPSVQMQLTPPGKDTVADPGVAKVVPTTNGAAPDPVPA